MMFDQYFFYEIQFQVSKICVEIKHVNDEKNRIFLAKNSEFNDGIPSSNWSLNQLPEAKYSDEKGPF